MKTISGNTYIKKDKDIVLIDKIPLTDFLNKYKTPFLVFLENRLRDNINSFIEVFNSTFTNFHCFYSFKANFLPDICNIVFSEGIGAEIIALPELNLALKIGFPPEKIIVGGPFLPEELIEKSIETKVLEIIVYSLNDLKKINDIAQKYGIIQKICLRINSEKYNSRLGIFLDEKHLLELKKCHDKFNNIKISTILSHRTTQMNNVNLFIENTNVIIDNFRKIQESGINIENINLGGGFPEAAVMPYSQLVKIANEMRAIIKNSGIDYKKIYFEPGRYFIGDAGLYIAKIIKVTKNRWIFLNIGNHICPKFARCSLRFYNVSQINEPHKYKTSFAGILPTDQDVLAKNYFFVEKLNEGDVILVTNVGAYTLTFSNRFPYPLPKIFLVSNENIKQIFNPSTNHDFSITI